MKTIMKTLFVAITSFAVFSSANAGEMTVSGSAKATWSNVSGAQAAKGFGIANELTFGATGELDNGYTWSVAIALDPTTSGQSSTVSGTEVPSGSAINDDTSLTLTAPGMGILGLHVSAGGFNGKYGWAADAYTAMSDTGFAEGQTYPGDLGSTSNIQFATEAGLLPLGAVIQAGYGYGKKDGQSTNTQGNTGTDNMAAYGLTLKPVDGLTIGATYNTAQMYDDATVHSQEEEGGAAYAKYAVGPITVGYGKSWKAPTNGVLATTAGATTVEFYENTGVSIGYALNDQVRISYTNEKGERNFATSATTTSDIKMTSYQIAYNIGGATLSLVRNSTDNVGFVSNVDSEETLVSLAMAF